MVLMLIPFGKKGKLPLKLFNFLYVQFFFLNYNKSLTITDR